MKKKLLKFFAVACSLTCIATAGVGFALSGDNDVAVAKAYEITLTDGNGLEKSYLYGDLLSVPVGTIEGNPTTRFIVFSPTGNAYNTPSVSLLEEGQYTVVWYANVGGKEVSASKTFYVAKSAFTLEGGGTYAYVENLERASEEDGVKISLEAESTFRYNRAIDLTDMSVPFARLFPYQRITNLKEATTYYTEESAKIKQELQDGGITDKDEINKEIEKRLGKQANYFRYSDDARNYLITLTDRYDPTNYVTIDLEWIEGRTYWNFRAGAVGQTAHGIRGFKEGVEEIVTIDGVDYNYYYAPSQGRTSCNLTDDRGLDFYYDVETNRLYTTFYRYTASGETKNEKALVADLSNEVIYPYDSFKGFTTGEVYLSISAKNYLNETANIDIASLGGISGRDLLNADMKDTKDPVIAVDEDLRQGNTFIAVGEEIEIPSAIAYDLNLPYGTKATVAVYYAYDPNSNKNASVGVVNGKFTPTKSGVYTIVYTATDSSGNVGTATVDLQSREGVDNKAVKLTVDASIGGYAGDSLEIPECTIAGLYSDESALKTYVQFENGEKSLLTGDTLFLKGVGKYELTYVYETPFKTYETRCTITASASDNVTLDAPVLPEYFIKGAKYTLEPVYAYEYTTKEPVATETKMFMRADNGEYVEVNRKEVAINANSTVSFKYEYKGVVTYSETIAVLDVGFGGELAAEKYFHSEENVIGAATSNGVRYFADETTKNATLKYINMLSLSSFGFDFTFLKEINGDGRTFSVPTSLTLTLVDYYDRNNKVTLRFSSSGAETVFSIDGASKATFEKALLGNKISVFYDGGFFIEGKTYAWDGAFTSDRMLLWVSLDGIKGNTCLEITSLGIGTLKKAKTDKVDPVLTYSELNVGYQSLNKVITVAQAYAYDLIAPYVESGLSLTVTQPDGSFATSEDGVKLDGTCSVSRAYKLKLTMLGQYTIKYTYVDQNGNDYVYVDRPTVQDQMSPVIMVNGVKANEVVTAAWGANVKVASYTATDETTASDALKSWVCVFCPSGIIRQVANGGTFYAREKGKYTVFYHCYDETGNYATFKYFVVVS